MPQTRLITRICNIFHPYSCLFFHYRLYCIDFNIFVAQISCVSFQFAIEYSDFINARIFATVVCAYYTTETN